MPGVSIHGARFGRWLPIALSAWLSVMSLAGCLELEDYGPRARTEYGPFEEEMFGLWVRELELSEPPARAPARVQRLESMARDVRWALSKLPEGRVGRSPGGLMDTMARPGFLALWKDGTMMTLSRGTAELLSRAVDAGLGRCVAAGLAERPGVDPDAGWRFLGRAMSARDLDLRTTMAGVVSTGLLDGLVADLAPVIDGSTPIPSPQTVTRHLLADLCQGRGVECLRDTEWRDDPWWSVRVDSKGNPRVNQVPGTGQLAAPFVDEDHDGEADTDAQSRPVSVQGEPIRLPPFANGSVRGEPRDSQGRALMGGRTDPIYDYVDLRRTVPGLAMPLLHAMVTGERPPLYDLLEALPIVLGEPLGRGYDQARSPAAMLVWAIGELASYPRLADLADALSRVVLDHPDLITRLLVELDRAASILDDYPDLPDLLLGTNLVDHLIGDNPFRALTIGDACDPTYEPPDEACSNPTWARCSPQGVCVLADFATGPPGILEQVAEEGLLEQVLSTLGSAGPVRTLPESLATMLTRTGTDLSGLTPAGCRGPVPSRFLATCWLGRVDRSAPGVGCCSGSSCQEPCMEDDPFDDEVLFPGRSGFQDLLALVYDTNRLVFVPDLGDAAIGVPDVLLVPGAFRIDDVATFYLDSVVSNAMIQSSALDLDTRLMRSVIASIFCEFTLEDDDRDVLTVTAPQLTLWVLGDHSTHDVGDVIDHQGARARWHDADMLVAAAVPPPSGPDGCPGGQGTSLLDGLAPLIADFSTWGRPVDAGPRGMMEPPGRTQLFVDLLSTLHIHWGPEPQHRDCPMGSHLAAGDVHCSYHSDDLHPFGLYSFDRQEGTNLRAYEPALARILTETGLWDAVLDLSAALGCRGQGADHVCPAHELTLFAAWLLDRDSHARGAWNFPDGAAVGQAGVRRGDRVSWEARPSRAYLFLEAARELAERSSRPELAQAEAAWERTELLHTLVADPVVSKITPYLLGGVLGAIAGVMRDEVATRGLEGWRGQVERVRDWAMGLVSSPAARTLYDLWTHMDPRARSSLLRALARVTDPARLGEDDLAGPLLQTLVSWAQGPWPEDAGCLESLGAFLGAISGVGRTAQAGIEILDQDPEGLFTDLGANLSGEDRTTPESRFPLRIILDAIGQTLREDPRARGPLSATDLERVAGLFERFLTDERHGVGRLEQIVSTTTD